MRSRSLLLLRARVLYTRAHRLRPHYLRQHLRHVVLAHACRHEAR